MMKTVLVVLFLVACGDGNHTKPVDGQVTDIPQQDSSLDSTQLRDSAEIDGVTDSVTADSPEPDAPIDAAGVICRASVAIGGINNTRAVIGTLMTCPLDESYQVVSKIYAAGDILQESFLQGNVGCGNPTTLGVIEPKSISRIDVFYKIIQTGEAGICPQN